MTIQWITINPETQEGLVVAPPVPPAEADYAQTLEWSGLRHLMREVHDARAGDMNLNKAYIRACDHYCKKWNVELAPAESQPTT